jgi:hypothetical protein
MASGRCSIRGRRSYREITDALGVAQTLVGTLLSRAERACSACQQRVARLWTTTIVLPIPSALSDFREVTVAGEQGVLLVPWRQDGKSTGERTWLWQKDGIVYVLSGPREYETMLRMAESMF